MSHEHRRQHSRNAHGGAADALIAFAGQVIGGDYIASGHSSGGILAAYVAAHDHEHVSACVLEDPPLFRVTPDEVQENAGAFAWYDGYTIAHSFLQQSEVTAYPAWYASHSYLFGLFGGLQKMLAEQTAAFCDKHPGEHATNALSHATGRVACTSWTIGIRVSARRSTTAAGWPASTRRPCSGRLPVPSCT